MIAVRFGAFVNSKEEGEEEDEEGEEGEEEEDAPVETGTSSAP